jgi:hypothetical protein
MWQWFPDLVCPEVGGLPREVVVDAGDLHAHIDGG